jgi:dephospho-CoA kinase
VVVVSIAPDIQKKRVLDRGEMNEAQFETILARQMPDAEKRSRAAWVIETTGLEATRGDVAKILSQIRERLALA